MKAKNRMWLMGFRHAENDGAVTSCRATNGMEVEMKGKIEAAANLIVIVFAVVVGPVFLKDRLSPPAPESEAVKAGDKLPKLDGWDWRAHDQTLVLGLRKGCHFCEDSAPFYQRLTAQQQQGGSNPAILSFYCAGIQSQLDVRKQKAAGLQSPFISLGLRAFI